MNGATTVFTIATLSYLPRVRLLHRSLQETNPSVRFFAVVVDDVERAGTSEAFEVVDASDVIDPVELRRMATMYDATELSTALKPFALRTALERVDGPVTYLDPDIVVFGPLGDALTPPDHAALALTPHCLQPIPRDGLDVSEATIQAAGTFNLGYCCVSGDETGRGFVDWWAERLLRDAIIDPGSHRFTDQRWIDLAVGHFPTFVHRDPTLNVAYWNMHERTLELVAAPGQGRPWRSEDRPEVLVDGRPLTFFHYSGFDTTGRASVSRYLARGRVDHESPAWVALADYYRRGLEAVRGGEPTRYGYGYTAVGQRVTPGERQAYRSALVQAEHAVIERGGTIVEGRPDLPDEPAPAFGPDGGVAFARESRYDERTGRGRSAGDVVAATGVGGGLLGVNVIGYLGAETGVGHLGRSLWHSLRVTGCPVTTTWVDDPGSRARLPSAPPHGVDRPYRTDLVVVNADQFAHQRTRVRRELHTETTVGVWAWETEQLPVAHLVSAAPYVDRVLAISAFTADAVRRTAKRIGVDLDVDVVPLAVDVDMPVVDRSRASLGLGDGPLVVFCFDHNSVAERKNPIAAVEAFRRAFPRSGAATLVVKTTNARSHPDAHRRLVDAAAGRDDIVIRDGYTSPVRVQGLIAAADVYLSLHRSEGFGYTIAEAMALGTAVVATGYGGSMDFTAPGTAGLVPYDLVEIPDGIRPYSGTGGWADPDVDAAADLLATLMGDADARADQCARARDHLRGTRSPVHCGNELADLLGVEQGAPPW